MDKAFLCFKCTKEPTNHILADGGFWLTSCLHVFCTACHALVEEQKTCLFCKKACKCVAVNSGMDAKLKELFMPLDGIFKERMKKMKDKLAFQEELRKHYVRGFNKKKADYAQALEYCKKSNQMSKEQTEHIDKLKRQVLEMSTTLKRTEMDLENAKQKIADYEVQLSEMQSSSSGDQMQCEGGMGEATMEHLFKQPYSDPSGSGTALNMSSYFRHPETDAMGSSHRASTRNSVFDSLEGASSGMDSMFPSNSQLANSEFGMDSQSDTMSFRLGSPRRCDLSMQSEMTTPKLLGVHKRMDYPQDPMFDDSPARTPFPHVRRSVGRETPGKMSHSPVMSLGKSASRSSHKSPGSSLGFKPGTVTSSSIILKNSF